jgi:hypothetical protein
MTTEEAINQLIKQLVNDREYWLSWKATIALCFSDEYLLSYKRKGVDEISDTAAENFLKMLTEQSNDNANVSYINDNNT